MGLFGRLTRRLFRQPHFGKKRAFTRRYGSPCLFSVLYGHSGRECALTNATRGDSQCVLRWNFHRLMLGQSLSFYQDEFTGRVSAKVMQTALAVRDTVVDHCGYVGVCCRIFCIYLGLVLAALDTWF